jgi:hypothetical protein
MEEPPRVGLLLSLTGGATHAHNRQPLTRVPCWYTSATHIPSALAGSWETIAAAADDTQVSQGRHMIVSVPY